MIYEWVGSATINFYWTSPAFIDNSEKLHGNAKFRNGANSYMVNSTSILMPAMWSIGQSLSMFSGS